MTTETSNARGEWVLVPRVPTDEMLTAFHAADKTRAPGISGWAAMLAAAPPPAAARGDVRGLVVVPPQAEPVTDPSFSGGAMRKGDWAIPSGQGCVRVVDERMAYGWNQCREETLQALAAEGVQAGEVDGEALARRFHETYERLAPSFGYETRTDTRRFDSTSSNGRLMIAVCAELSQQPEARGVVDGPVSDVAWHIGKAVEYIEKQWPDAKQLDRGPILRNMRRWHQRLTAALTESRNG